MTIKFYSMGNRCGHCVNTEKNILKKEIAAGKVVVLPASQAPKGKFQGFPAFVSDLTGKSSMGAPKSYNQLAKKLGHHDHHDHHEKYSHPEIIFYSMPGCGYCVKAEQLLKKQIQDGTVIKKSASEANGQFNGFPAFVSTKTGKSHTGLPPSYNHLTKKLGHHDHHEKYSHPEIIFYSMPGCGYCVKAEQLLKKQIQDGTVIKKSASETNGQFNGFPAFVSTKTGKSHTGLPQSYEHLAAKIHFGGVKPGDINCDVPVAFFPGQNFCYLVYDDQGHIIKQGQNTQHEQIMKMKDCCACHKNKCGAPDCSAPHCIFQDQKKKTKPKKPKDKTTNIQQEYNSLVKDSIKMLNAANIPLSANDKGLLAECIVNYNFKNCPTSKKSCSPPSWLTNTDSFKQWRTICHTIKPPSGIKSTYTGSEGKSSAPSSHDHKKKKLSKLDLGLIIGGSVLGLLIIGVIIWMLVKYDKK